MKKFIFLLQISFSEAYFWKALRYRTILWKFTMLFNSDNNSLVASSYFSETNKIDSTANTFNTIIIQKNSKI